MAKTSVAQMTKAIRAGGGSAVLGAAHIEAKLSELALVASPKAARAGINAMLGQLTKALRAGVNASSASPELKRAARKTIGKRFGKAKGGKQDGQQAAKVGFGVAKKMPKRGKNPSGGKGVGLSASNVHWFAIGTQTRKLSKGSPTGPKAGHPTGKVEPVLGEATQKALAVGAGPAMEAARAKIQSVLFKEAQKKG